MKLSAHYKKKGIHAELFDNFSEYDQVYVSKVFTWSEFNEYVPETSINGGTGYGLNVNLTDEIEHECPDYTLYNLSYSVGFLTRGCIRKCKFCVVPEKEGEIREHADIDEFIRHEKAVFLDNNALAHDHGIRQIEKIAKLGIKADFNQGLDFRLVDQQIAKLLSSVKWIRFIRTACDHKSQMEPVNKAVKYLEKHGVKSYRIFCYLLVNDIDDALERVEFLRGLGVDIFAQPYRDLKNNKGPSIEQRRFARWVNHKAIFKTISWEEYQNN
jgi:hypothetical protein